MRRVREDFLVSVGKGGLDLLSDERVRELASEAYQEVQIWDYDLPIVEAIRTAVVEAVAAERKICAEIAQRECSAAHVVAIGQDVAAAILTCGGE